MSEKTNEEVLEKENTETELSEVEILQNEITELKEKLKEEEGNYMRLHADFQNFSKRKQNELEQMIAYSSKNIIEKLLPTYENLGRAIEAFKQEINAEDNSLFKGVEMTYNNFKHILEQEGLEEINPENEIYDPNFHEAVATVSDQEQENEKIVSVYSKGYKLKGKLLQTAKVQINKK